jgi:hypothetical protein
MQEEGAERRAPRHCRHDVRVPLVDALEQLRERELIVGVFDWSRLLEVLERLDVPVAHLQLCCSWLIKDHQTCQRRGVMLSGTQRCQSVGFVHAVALC